MSAVTDSRKQVLESIRAATAGSASRNSVATAGKAAEAHLEIPRDYVRQGVMTVSARHERFVERLREYDAEVVECSAEGLAATITAVLAASGRHRFVAPPGIPAEWYVDAAWKVEGFECTFDHGLETREIEQAEGVITACFCGIADSGTIVLHHSASEGRRVLTLLPDWHLCVVRLSQVVETLPEYFDKCREQGNKGTRERESREQGTGIRDQSEGGLPKLVTWISGPSATADIEMTRIKGVHGPRFLNVILVKDREAEIGG
jgi:L-lactate dehydrogenase complex protein LldG